MSDIDRNILYSQLTVRMIQIKERIATIMEAWDDKSKSVTNRKLSTMYNQVWDEFNQVEKQMNEIEAHRVAKLKIEFSK